MTLPPTLIVGTADSDDDLTIPAIYGTLAGEPIDGLAGDDAIYGDGGQPGGGDDVITGGDGRDYLDGEDGDDLLEPGPMDAPVTANQTVRGGAGTDTLFLRGFPADYEFFDYPGGFIANARNANAPEGQVAAYSIERVAFGVGVFDYAYGGIPAAAIVDVAQLVPGLAADRAPIALGDTVTAARGATEVRIALSALTTNDLDLDGDAFVLAELGAGAGIASIEAFDADPSSALPDVPPEYSADFPDGLVRVVLDAPLAAPVTFEYRLADAATGTLTGNTATVTVRPSAAPTAAADTLKATIGRDTFFSYDRLLANDSSGLTFLRIVPDSVVASNGVRVDDEGSGLRVTSFDTVPGTLSFTYEAVDELGSVASATVNVEVTNRAPLVADGAAVVSPGSTYVLRFADLVSTPGTFDPDLDALTVAFYSLTLPPTVTLMGFEDRIEFTFAANYAGDYALDFALADATGAQDAGRFRFLTATPAAPVAVADTLRWAISGSPGQAFGTFSLSRLLANDSIAPGLRAYADPVSFVQPVNGTLYVEPGNPNSVVPTNDPLNLMLSYMPRAGFTGLDTLTYDIVDELGRRSTTTLTFDVSVPAPVVPETTIAIPEGATSVTFPVSALLTNATVVGPVRFSGHAIRFDQNSGVLEAQVDPITGRYVGFTYTPDPDTVLGEDAFFIGFVDEGADGGSARGSTFVRFARATAVGATVSLSTADAGVTPEGNAANSTLNGPLTFEIVRSGDLTAASSVTFTLAAAPGSTLATEDIGVVAVGGNSVGTGLGTFTANFTAGQARLTVSVFPVGDLVPEADEALRLTLTGVGNGVLGSLTTATAIITNDDLPPPVFQITSVGPERVEEGTAPGTANSFSVSVARRSGTDLGAAQVFIEIQGAGAAPVGLDDLINGLGNGYFVDFAAGQTTATLSVPITSDSTDEADETVRVALSFSTLGAVDGTPSFVTIVNDDLPPPVFQITAAGPERVEEGTAPGTSNSFSVSVARDRGSDLGAARVFIEIQGTGATPVGLDDLVNGLGNGYFVDFAEGQMTATLSVPITPDSTDEPDEFVRVVLSSSTYGGVDEAPYLLTIVNDDVPLPVFQITAAAPERVEEGTAPGTSNSFSVTVARDRGSDLGAARVFIEIQGTGATPVGLDDLINGLGNGYFVDFAEGQMTATLSVPITPDSTDEPDEFVRVVLSSSTYGGVDETPYLLTIVNDDVAPPVFQITAVGPERVEEGTAPGTSNSFSVTVARDRGSDLGAARVFIEIQGTGATPVGLADLVNGLGNGYFVDFAEGQMTATLSVPITPDSTDEPDEFVRVVLSSGTYGGVDETPYLVTIVNDDLPPPVFMITSVGPYRVEEGTAPGTSNSFSVSVGRVSGDLGAARVFIEIQGTDATPAGLDDLVNGLGNGYFVDFAEGQMTATLSVPITPDSTDEPDEFVRVTLSSSTYGEVDSVQYTVTILDDDTPQTADLSIDSRILVGGEIVGVDEFGSPAGTTYTVRLTVANAAGAAIAADARVRITFPDAAIDVRGLLPEDADVTVDDVSATGLRTIWWQVGALGPGASADIDLDLTSLRPDEVSLVAEIVESTAPDPDSTPGNGTAAVEDDDLAVVLFGTPGAPPVVRADSFTVVEGGTLTLPPSQGLLVNDDVLRGSTITVSGSHPGVSLNVAADGGITFVAPSGITATSVYVYSYTVTDAFGQTSAPATISVQVDDRPSPTGQSDTYVVFEGETLNISALLGLLANDAPATGTRVASTSAPNVGTVTVNPDGAFTFVAPAAVTEDTYATFDYVLVDAQGQRSAPISVTVLVANRQLFADVSIEVLPAQPIYDFGTTQQSVTVRVRNDGPSAVDELRVAFAYQDFTVVNATTASGTSAFDTGSGSWTVGPLAAGATADLVITSGTAPGGVTPRLTAEITQVRRSGEVVLDPDSTAGNGTGRSEDDEASGTWTVRLPQEDLRVDVRGGGSSSFIVGQSAGVTVAVSNAGFTGQSVDNVVVQVNRGGYATTAFTPSVGSFDAATGVWTVGTLAPGGTATLELSGRSASTLSSEVFAFVRPATVLGYANQDPDSSNDRDFVRWRADPAREDLRVDVRGGGSSSHIVGQSAGVTVAVSNAGFTRQAVDNVVVQVNRFGYNTSAFTPSVGSFDSATGLWTIGTLGPGGTATLEFSGTSASTFGSEVFAIVRPATVLGYANVDRDSSNDRDSVTWRANPAREDLRVDVRGGGSSSSIVGQSAGVTVAVSNAGFIRQPVDNVVVQVNRFGYATTAFTPSVGSFDSATGLWTIGTLGPGGTATLDLSGTSASTFGSEVFAIVRPATVLGYANVDRDSSNDRDAVTWRANPAREDLGVDVRRLSSTAPLVDQNVDVEVVVSSAGRMTLNTDNVVVQLSPTNYLASTFTPSMGTYDAATGRWTVGTLGPGQRQATLRITGSSIQAGPAEMSASLGIATVLGFNNQDIVAANNADIESWTVPLPPRPSGLPDDYFTDEGVALVVPAASGLLANDGQSRFTVVHSITQPTIGTLAYQADGSFTYTPPRHVAGDQRATFVYTLRDASGQLSDPVEVAILVRDVIAPADLSLDMQMVVGGVVQTGTAFGFDPGEAFTLRLVARNDGPGDADGVIVRLPLADDDFDVLGTLPEDADLERDASGYLWRVGTLAGGDEVSLDIELGALRRGTFALGAEIVQSRSPDPDSTPGNGAGEDDEAGFTVEVENAPPVAVGDRYRAEPGVVLEVSGPGVLGNDTDANGDPLFLDLAALDTTGLQGTLEFIAPDGSFRFRAADGFTGTTSFRYGVTDRNGGVTLGTVTLDVIPRPLRVASFAPTDSGVRMTFDQPLAVSKFNLYGDAGQPAGAPDLELVGTTTGRVRGSVVLDADGQGLVFVRTGGVLPPDTYTLTVRSGANGAQSFLGGWLDGNGDGTAGDDYRTTFTVRASDASVLSLPDVVRGPGQSASLPLSLTNAAGVTELHFDLLFTETDLAVSALRFADGVSGNIALQAIAGGLRVDVLFDRPLGAGTQSPLIADVTVYEQSTYGTAHRITWGDITLRRGDTGALETVRGDDAVQVSAYFMDASGNRGYSMLDVQRLRRVVAGPDTGLAAYPTLDPVLIGDLNGNGQLTTLDLNRFLQFVQGQVRPEIPALPTGSTPLDFTGPTRNLVLGGSRSAAAGSVVRVPLTLDNSAGVESLTAKIVYDASRLDYLGAKPGADFEFRLIRERAGEIVVDLARLDALGTGIGELVVMDFQVKAAAPAGAALVDLQVLRLNDGKLLQAAASQPGADATDAEITVIAPAPPAPPLLRSPASGTQPTGNATPIPGPVSPTTSSSSPSSPPPGAPSTPDPAPAPAAAPAAEDWRKAPWARDLARRIAQIDAPATATPATPIAKSVLARMLTAAMRR